MCKKHSVGHFRWAFVDSTLNLLFLVWASSASFTWGFPETRVCILKRILMGFLDEL